MIMCDMLIKTITSLLKCLISGNKNTKRAKLEPGGKTKRFLSLYLLGDGFFMFHFDVESKSFARWLKNNDEQLYKSHINLINDLVKLSFQELVEKLYEFQHVPDYEIVVTLFRRWYVREHGVFRFHSQDHSFIPLTNSHLLQVLYDIQEKDIIIIDNLEKIEDSLTSLGDYKNNWFIGVDGCDPLSRAIAGYLIEGADLQLAHYKIVNNDNEKNGGFIQMLKARGISNFDERSMRDVTTTPYDKVTQDRLNRYDQFDSFARFAGDKFKGYLAVCPKAKRFDDLYSLCVWNDKQHPKNNVTFVNVGFDKRMLIVSHNNKGFTSTVEEGARLCFYRMETGFVTISLYPAKTDNRKCIEDCIILKQSIDPKDLFRDKTLKSFFYSMISYMECTSIDGNPSYLQKIKVGWLRFKCHMVENNVYKPTHLADFWGSIGRFVVTVGFSGIVVFGLQIAYNLVWQKKTSINHNDVIVQHIDSLHNTIQQSRDSLNHTLKILKNSIDVNSETGDKAKNE